MNELLLIDLLSELNPELLQDDFMEKDRKHSLFSFLKKLKNVFSFGKSEEHPLETFEEEEILETADSYEKEKFLVNLEEHEEYYEENSSIGFGIHIFKKKINIFVKIISGITATLVLLIGLILFFITKNKGGFLLKRNKAALN